jgi:hypothetical protein
MSSPLPYLVRMLLFLAAVACVVYFLLADLVRVFLNTPTLDAVILGVLAIGIFFVFRQVVILWPEVKWLRRFQHREEGAPPPPAESINLLAPMATMLGERQDQIRLSPTATRALLDGIATRLDERRELARYMIGLLIFLGLLGTFWGLLQTIGAVADAINSLQVNAGDAVQMFARLKASIDGPLKGMSTAFGASLFGLSGSLVLGFLELQASQAQGRFHTELEEWLARATSITGPALSAGASVPAYVEALLERNVEGTDGLLRALHRVEESRQSAVTANNALIERLASLAETMRAQQNLLARFTELSIELRGAVVRLADTSASQAATQAEREALLTHQRNVEAHLARLVEESTHASDRLAEELRALAGRVADRSEADADREAILAQQRSIEAGLARAVDDSTRGRKELIDELRGLAARVTDRAAAPGESETLQMHQRNVDSLLTRISEESARVKSHLSGELQEVIKRLSGNSGSPAERQSFAAYQQNIEALLARLVEENARNRSALVEELRSAIGRLSERFGETGGDALAAHQRNIETHLARLSEETAQNRIALADELRGEIRLLARTVALARTPSATGAPAGNED